MEDLQRQQLVDRERIRSLEKQLNAMDVRYQQGLDGLRQDVLHSQRCCDAVSDLKNRITDAERKISSSSEDFDILLDRLDKELRGSTGTSNSGSSRDGLDGVGHGRDGAAMEDILNNKLKDLERQVNNTVQQVEQRYSHLENDLKDYFHRDLGDLRTVFLDRFDDQAFRIADIEMEVEQVISRISDHDKKLSKLENITQRLEECDCRGFEEGGGDRGREERDKGNEKTTEEGDRREIGDKGDGGASSGDLPKIGGGKDNTTEKSLEWRVVANEDQIRHFNSRIKDLSVSGDSLYDKVRLNEQRHKHAKYILQEMHFQRII